MSSYKLVAPNIDLLLRYFDHRHMNPSVPTPALTAAMEPLFSALTDLAPLENNEEVKTIQLQIPRGSIDDYDSYEDLEPVHTNVHANASTIMANKMKPEKTMSSLS